MISPWWCDDFLKRSLTPILEANKTRISYELHLKELPATYHGEILFNAGLIMDAIKQKFISIDEFVSAFKTAHDISFDQVCHRLIYPPKGVNTDIAEPCEASVVDFLGDVDYL